MGQGEPEEESCDFKRRANVRRQTGQSCTTPDLIRRVEASRVEIAALPAQTDPQVMARAAKRGQNRLTVVATKRESPNQAMLAARARTR